MKRTKIFLSLIVILAAFLYLPSTTRVHAATGTVCLVAPGATSCPTSPASLTGTVGTQLRVAIFLQGSDAINGFDVTTLANHTVLKPAGIDLKGTILVNPTSIVAECLSGILISGSVCPSTDTIDTLHFAAVGAPGVFSTATTGLLFTAIYNITSATSGIPLGFQTGCSNTSVSPNTCVTIANGTPIGVPETVQTATFSTTTNPDFIISASPSALTITPGNSGTSTISITSVNGFAFTVNLVAGISPAGPLVSVNPTSLAIGAGQTLTATLTISTSTSTTPGTYTATVNGTGGSLNHSTTVTVTLPSPPKPDFTMFATPGSLTIIAGGSSNDTITVTSVNGFSGTVTLSSSTGPPGITATLATSNVVVPSGGSASTTLSVSTTPSTAPGSYGVLVTGTGGTLSHSVNIAVTVTPSPQPDFTMTASPTTVTIGAGTSGTSTVTLMSVNGFTGTISLTVVSTPGLTATVSPTSVTNSGTAVLSVTSNTPGSYSARVIGTSGSLSHNVTVSVNVFSIGEICIVNPGTTSCPSSFLSFSGTTGSQLRVSVLIQATSPMNGFDITLLADHAIFKPAGVDLTGTIVQANPTVLVECLQGIIITGPTCSSTDTIDTLHLAAVTSNGGFLTNPGATGLLFTAIYNITTTTTGTVINFQTGCTGTSVSGGVCVTISNGTCCPVPETIPGAPSPSFSIRASPASLSITRGSQGTSMLNLTSLNGFAGMVSISSSLFPSVRHGPTTNLSASSVTLTAGGTGTVSLTIVTNKNTPTGTYTITITGASGSITSSVTITVTITR